jgi:MGT family glycosyltransferase
MKIAWFCIPAYGHTNPTLGLVQAMTRAGHQVYYFSFAQFQAQLEQAGAHVILCDGYDLEMQDKGNADRIGKDIAFSTELLVSSTLALDDMVAQQVAAIQPDLIVSDSVAYWGKLTAMKYHIPYVSSTTTFAFNQHSAKYIKHSAGELFRMLLAMPKVKRQIKRLQQKGYPVKSVLEIVQNDDQTNTIVYTSPYFQPCAETFSQCYHFIGPSIRPIQHPMEKTAEKTIYLSLGTVIQNQTFYQTCIEALQDTPYHVILSLGSNADIFGPLPDHIQVYESVDQMAALSIADVFVTHCGMNSASEGLYFEVPLVLCPQTPEQEAVATRVAELGAGLRPSSLRPADLLSAIQQALSQPQYREGAARIAQSFRAAGGAEEARRFFESIVAQG